MAKSKKNTKKVNKNDHLRYNKKVEEVNTSLKTSTVVKCIIGVIVVLVLFYLLTLYITDKNMRDSVKVQEASIQYEVILAGESFNQKKDDYLVLYFDEENISDYSEALSEYNDKEEKVSLYKCYTNEALNKKFVSMDANQNPEKAEDLKVTANTLIRFKENKVAEYITGKDEITSYLENLSS